jgi:hypothetical protein
MRTSDAINEISTALAKVQGEVSNPVFNKTNPHFKSSYADLSSVLNAVRPYLSKNGISLMQMTNLEESGLVLYTRLVHSSGQWIESVYPVTASGKHQEIAAALTYAKRLSLSAIVGVAGEDDDDGNAANNVEVKAKAAPKPKVEASKLTEEENAKITSFILAELDECRSKEDLQMWASKNAPTKQTLWEDSQKQVTKAFQDAQARVRDAAK